jgi:hypothetical protein
MSYKVFAIFKNRVDAKGPSGSGRDGLRASFTPDGKGVETAFARRPDQTFAFNLDRVFQPAADADEIYRTCGEYVANGACAGQNGVILAYGHGESGSFATVFGTVEESLDSGLLLKSCRALFASGAPHLSLSIVEVFKETFRDVLQQSTGRNAVATLRLRDTLTHTAVEGASEETVSTMEELCVLMSACRSTIESTKGHCVVTVRGHAA